MIEGIAMAKTIAALSLSLSLVAGAAWAQAFPPNEAGVTMGHWHLNSRNIEANKNLFVAMGGKPIKPGAFEIVMFPGVAVFLHQAPDAPPNSGGTVGSVVNHVGFVVQNVPDSVARWKAAGVTVEPGGNGRLDQAYVTTIDGLRIEILEDKTQSMPIRNEHVHFQVAETEIPKMQAWYAKTFGGKAEMRNNAPVVNIPGVQLRIAKNETKQVTTKGRVLDHIGFDVKNLEAFTKKLEADGIKLDRPYAKNPQTGAALAFIYDPWGTYIELNERPTPLM
jgi:catechol 2,3-dioxygenase-like lactoylglutathione lyase family enzyme/predicted enzyme related to lactoylglutathione lyase